MAIATSISTSVKPPVGWAVVPVMILYFLAQRELIEGIVMTGLKA
jgi:hypothetical protein